MIHKEFKKFTFELGRDAEERLSIELLDFSHWEEFRVVYLLTINVWVVFFSVTLDFSN